MYSANHRIEGLPEHVEQIFRRDLELPLLKTILEHDLGVVSPNYQLNAVVVDFKISTSKNVQWHTSQIRLILDLFHNHPQGGQVRFGQVFMTPKYVKIPIMSGPYVPNPDFFKLFMGVNNYINHLMQQSGTRSCFGSLKKHMGISKSAKGWTELAWKGFKPSQPR